MTHSSDLTPAYVVTDADVVAADIDWGKIAYGPLGKLIGTANEPADLLNGLVSWWTFNETSGTRIDSHGSYDLIDVNTSVGNAAGKQGNAADFEAGSNSTLKNVTTDFRGNAGDFSFALWFNQESTADFRGLIHAGNGLTAAVSDYLLAISSSNELTWLVSDGGSWKTVIGTTISNSTWYFVVVYYDATNDLMGISVNGGGNIELTGVTNPQGVSNTFHIGYYSSYQYYDGLMDEIGYWNRLLGPTDIAALYNDGDGIAYASLS